MTQFQHKVSFAKRTSHLLISTRHKTEGQDIKRKKDKKREKEREKKQPGWLSIRGDNRIEKERDRNTAMWEIPGRK